MEFARPAALPPIMVAPNGARLTRRDHPALPVTIEQLIETARACADAGAGAMHFHVRDNNDNDRHVLDAGLYREALAGLGAATPKMHLQITTEAVGRYSPGEMRALAYAVMPPGISIGIAEMIPGGVATAEDIRLYCHLHEAGVRVQHICYAPGDIATLAAMLGKAGIDPGGVWCLFVIGHYSGQVSNPALIAPFLDTMAANMPGGDARPDWAICAFGAEEQSCLEAAQSRGGKIRVGFENSLLMPDGSIARDNAARVAAAAGIAWSGRAAKPPASDR